jgi:hypothetical protein
LSSCLGAAEVSMQQHHASKQNLHVVQLNEPWHGFYQVNVTFVWALSVFSNLDERTTPLRRVEDLSAFKSISVVLQASEYLRDDTQLNVVLFSLFLNKNQLLLAKFHAIKQWESQKIN